MATVNLSDEAVDDIVKSEIISLLDSVYKDACRIRDEALRDEELPHHKEVDLIENIDMIRALKTVYRWYTIEGSLERKRVEDNYKFETTISWRETIEV